MRNLLRSKERKKYVPLKSDNYEIRVFNNHTGQNLLISQILNMSSPFVIKLIKITIMIIRNMNTREYPTSN